MEIEAIDECGMKYKYKMSINYENNIQLISIGNSVWYLKTLLDDDTDTIFSDRLFLGNMNTYPIWTTFSEIKTVLEENYINY